MCACVCDGVCVCVWTSDWDCVCVCVRDCVYECECVLLGMTLVSSLLSFQMCVCDVVCVCVGGVCVCGGVCVWCVGVCVMQGAFVWRTVCGGVGCVRDDRGRGAAASCVSGQSAPS